MGVNLPLRILEQPFFTSSQKQRFQQRIDYAKRRGIGLIDDLVSLPYHLEAGEEYRDMKRQFAEELMALTPHYRKREMEFDLISDPDIKQLIEKEDIQLISWKLLHGYT